MTTTRCSLLFLACLACSSAAAQEVAELGTELVPNPTFADGAAGWTLRDARVEPELGLGGGGALALRAGAQAAIVLRPLPGDAARLLVQISAQGLNPDQSVSARIGEQLITRTLPVGEWSTFGYELAAPAGEAEITIEPVGSGTTLLGRVSAVAAAPAPDAGAGDVASMSAAEARVAAFELRPVVERLRGLPFLQDVPVTILDDDAAQQFFVARIEEFWPRERAAQEEIVYGHLGLWPAGKSIIDTYLDVLREQAGGFYDPDSDAFFMLKDMPRSTSGIIMAHELTHAVDDQHHDIDGKLLLTKGDGDREAAFSCVVEGSGTAIMSTFLAEEIAAERMSLAALAELQQSEMGKAEVLMAAPPLVQVGLITPYVLGMGFVARGNMTALARGVPPADIDRAFTHPPLSTEQILHPEKYWDEARLDPPSRVSVEDLSGYVGGDGQLAAEGTLGELNVALMTGMRPPDINGPFATLGSHWTNGYAKGWDGDRWQLYSAGDAHVVLYASVWDDEREATEFAEAAAAPGRLVERDGARVMLLAGAEESRLRELMPLALRGMSVEP